jgi:hypothetical protein
LGEHLSAMRIAHVDSLDASWIGHDRMWPMQTEDSFVVRQR